jgi:hypothetical protein
VITISNLSFASLIMAQKQIGAFTKINIIESFDDAFASEEESFTLKRSASDKKVGNAIRKKRKSTPIEADEKTLMENMRKLAARIR